MSLEKRLADLERRFAASSDGGGGRRPVHMGSVLRELGYLRSSQARYCRGNVVLEPENLPTKLLGENFQRRQLFWLATQRSTAPVEEIDDYVNLLCAISRRNGQDPSAVVSS
jgi:hypothetical protein